MYSGDRDVGMDINKQAFQEQVVLDLPSYICLEWLLYMVHESVNALRFSGNYPVCLTTLFH